VDPLRHSNLGGLGRGLGSAGCERRIGKVSLLAAHRESIANPIGLCHHSAAVPTYDYQCRSCGSMTEVIHSMLEEGPRVCERCGGELRRVIYPSGIIFKGSGFYRTDSREGGSSPAKPAPAASDPKSSTDAKPKAPEGEGKKASASSGD
jgi:putative FmdB family regulatory protein